MVEFSKTVSVVLPVHNCELYVQAAVQSILDQTYDDLELIVIDDCSSDTSPTILKSIADIDTRVIVHRNQTQLGVSKSLNIGIGLARGSYIARMDADDLSCRSRLEKQIYVLDKYHSVDVVGCNAYIIDEHSKVIGRSNVPTTSVSFKNIILFGSPFIHSTVMFRRRVFEAGSKYDCSYFCGQDYKLFSEIFHGENFFNLSDPLQYYRVHSRNVTFQANQDLCARYQLEKPIFKKMYQRNSISLSEKDYEINFMIADNKRFGEFDVSIFRWTLYVAKILCKISLSDFKRSNSIIKYLVRRTAHFFQYKINLTK